MTRIAATKIPRRGAFRLLAATVAGLGLRPAFAQSGPFGCCVYRVQFGQPLICNAITQAAFNLFKGYWAGKDTACCPGQLVCYSTKSTDRGCCQNNESTSKVFCEDGIHNESYCSNCLGGRYFKPGFYCSNKDNKLQCVCDKPKKTTFINLPNGQAQLMIT